MRNFKLFAPLVTWQASGGAAFLFFVFASATPAQQAAQTLQQAGFQVTVNKQGLGNRVYSISPSSPALPAGSTITINVGFTLF